MSARAAKFIGSVLLLVCILNVSSVWANNRGHKKLIRPLRNADPKRDATIHTPLKDVLRQLQAAPSLDTRGNREKRAPGDGPSYSTTELEDDTHSFALAIYSGRVNSEVIFLLTYDLDNFGVVDSSEVYRSSDYGNNFAKISSRIGNGAVVSDSAFVNTNDHEKVFFVGAQTAALYVSEDAGLTFTTRLIMPSAIDTSYLEFHPTEHEWILAHDPTTNTLYVTRDLAETAFTKVADNVGLLDYFQWGAYPYDQDLSTVYYLSNEMLYTQRYPYNRTTAMIFDPAVGAFLDYLLVERYIFLVVNGSDGNFVVWVSADRKPFQEAKIPSPIGHQYYYVNSIRSLQALLIIRHTDDRFHLYFSDEQGIYYYQALANLAVESFFFGDYIDLEAVDSSNDTTYVANQMVGSSLRTLISYDVGASWHRISSPEENETECVMPLCSLHFHMSISDHWRTGVYSEASAPGIIVAHGTLGESLNVDNGVSLYISIDGGITWTETLEDSWEVRILDHGSLIVGVPDVVNEGGRASRTLMYSCDVGTSWSPLMYTSNANLTIYGVRTEPGEITTVVTLYGQHLLTWTVIVIEFRDIFPSDCGPGDYYYWTPLNQYNENGCFLGARVSIERRREDVCCLNGHTYTRVVNRTVCSCTLEDYECHYGYKLGDLGGTCIRDLSVPFEPACGVGVTTYTHSPSYRKIGGDECTGGIEDALLPINIPCSEAMTDESQLEYRERVYLILFELMTVLLFVAIVIIICLVIAVVWLKVRRSDQFRPRQFENATEVYNTSSNKELEAMDDTN